MPLDHRFSLEESAVFVVVESLLAEKLGLLFSLCVLQVLFVFGYPFLLLFLGCAVVLIHLLQGQNKACLSTTVTQDMGDLAGSSSALQVMKGHQNPTTNQQDQTHHLAMLSPAAPTAVPRPTPRVGGKVARAP